MLNSKIICKNEHELQEAILKDKANGVPDLEIGQKYGVTYRYIEKLITKLKGVNVSSLNISKKVKKIGPDKFKEEETTVWSFKSRGNWATHSGEYRGNWSPYIPRNIILKYSKPGELVLDYFCGAGSTAVEAKLLGRKCIAFDINEKAIELAKINVNFNKELIRQTSFIKFNEVYEPELFVGDARDLSFLQDDSIDLICAHPPYANIIHYTDSSTGDLSFCDIDEFLEEMHKVAKESFRILKPGRQCAILIGDTRRKKHVVPLGFRLISIFLDAGFKLKELIIKRQHNCKTTGFWYANSVKYNFLLLAHEYLPIFEKPKFSVCSKIKESGAIYDNIEPMTEKRRLKDKKLRVESTTVWIAPESSDFDNYICSNLIERYSKNKLCLILDFSPCSRKGKYSELESDSRNLQLIYIKSSLLTNDLSQEQINVYFESVRRCIEFFLPKLNKEGFLVIQNKDMRINGFVEPLAKRIVDLVNFDALLLKEIVIALHENKSDIKCNNDNLIINHQYLIIYKKTEGKKNE